MEFDNIVLIHRENGKFIKEGFSINVDKCYENIKSFYQEDEKIFLYLNIEQDFTDEVFNKIFDELCYDDFYNLNVDIYPKDDEYYPTFVIEMEIESKEEIQRKVYDVLELFEEKVIKIYCNNI